MVDISLARRFFILFLLLVLTACGGGGGGSDSGSGSTGPDLGIFVDSPVEGLSYETDTLFGTTNAQGEFEFLPGETVTFSIGDMRFPSVPASSLLTPRDLANATSDPDQALVNLLRLMQTLDSQGDLSTITIDSDAVSAATGMSLDFTLPTADFEVAAANYLNAATGTATMVDEADAVAHFETSLNNSMLVGAWLSESDSGYSVLVFESTEFIIAHTNNSEPDNVVIDTDAFSYNPATGEIYPSDPISLSDGQGGISQTSLELTIKIDGDELTLTDDDKGTVVTFFRVSSSDSLVGAWKPDRSRSYPNVTVFLDNSRYLIAHPPRFDNVLGSISAAAEYGEYAWNTTTNEFSVVVSGQSDGEGGFSHLSQSSQLSIATDGSSLVITDPVEGSLGYTKIIDSCLLEGVWKFYRFNTHTNEMYLSSESQCDGTGISRSWELTASGDVYLRSETPYIDDLLDGVLKLYFESGALQQETIYERGEPVLEKWYFESGALRRETFYENGERLLDTFYYESGVLSAETPYVNGQIEGIARTYYESEALNSESTYVNGSEHGLRTDYYESGQVEETWQYVDGVQHGDYRGYHENGVLSASGQYDNGNKVGIWSYYLLSGDLTETQDYGSPP